MTALDINETDTHNSDRNRVVTVRNGSTLVRFDDLWLEAQIVYYTLGTQALASGLRAAPRSTSTADMQAMKPTLSWDVQRTISGDGMPGTVGAVMGIATTVVGNAVYHNVAHPSPPSEPHKK